MEKSNKDNDDVSDDIEIVQITPQTMTILFLSVIVVIVGLLQVGDTFNDQNRTCTLHTHAHINNTHSNKIQSYPFDRI